MSDVIGSKVAMVHKLSDAKNVKKMIFEYVLQVLLQNKCHLVISMQDVLWEKKMIFLKQLNGSRDIL